MTVGMDDLLILDHLIHICRLLTAYPGLLLKHMVCLFCNKTRRKQRQRCNDNNNKGDARILTQHENKRSDDGDHTGKQLCKSQQQTVSKLIHIRDHTAGDISDGMSIQIF